MEKGYKSLRIRQCEDIEKTVQRILNEVYNGKLDLSTARVLDQIINTRIRLMKVQELEARLEEIELLLETKENEHFE